MPSLAAPDGTTLAYHVIGEGDPVLCLPGGPTDSRYLGDLGGLSAHRRLIRADLRGTGDSGTPADLSSCRCDRLVDDVEALRVHLGLDAVDLLAHCAGANLAARYVERHPDRVSSLVLVTPSVRAVGLEITGDDRRETALSRSAEPWFAEAFAALERIVAGSATEEDWQAIAPFSYGRWDDEARRHHADDEARLDPDVVAALGADGAFDPVATTAALARFAAPVLVVAGGVDLAAPPRAMAEVAALFPAAELVVQPGAGHFPWLDDPTAFVAALTAFP